MTLDRPTRLRLRIAVFMLLVLVWAPGRAFLVTRIEIDTLVHHFEIKGEPIHENITHSGLLRVNRTIARTGQPITFDDSVLEMISAWNRLVDSLYWKDPLAHFDDELFKEANQYLVDSRTAIVNWIRLGDYLQAQMALGRALHTLQDFYAHSTWVEVTKAGVSYPNLGTTSFAISKTLASDIVCDPHALHTPILFTSGYFQLFQAGGIDTYSTSLDPQAEPTWPKNHCVHGTAQQRNADVGGRGINKDSALRDGHDHAREAATLSTTEYVNSILQELANDPNVDDEICGFLGQENSSACKAASGPRRSYPYFLTILNIPCGGKQGMVMATVTGGSESFTFNHSIGPTDICTFGKPGSYSGQVRGFVSLITGKEYTATLNWTLDSFPTQITYSNFEIDFGAGGFGVVVLVSSSQDGPVGSESKRFVACSVPLCN